VHWRWRPAKIERGQAGGSGANSGCRREIPQADITTRLSATQNAPPSVSGLGRIASADQMSIVSAISTAHFPGRAFTGVDEMACHAPTTRQLFEIRPLLPTAVDGVRAASGETTATRKINGTWWIALQLDALLTRPRSDPR